MSGDLLDLNKKWRVKTQFRGEENIYPDKFNSKQEAEAFVKDKMPFKIPATLIESAIAQGLIQFYQESSILDAGGNPIRFDNEETTL